MGRLAPTGERTRSQLARHAASVGRGRRLLGEAARERWRVQRRGARRRRATERGIVEGEAAAATLSRDAHFRRGLLASDLGAAALALSLSTVIFSAGPSLALALLAMPLLVLVNKLAGLYDRDELLLRRTTLEEAPDLFQAVTVYSLLVGLGTRVLEPGVSGHAEVLTLWPMLFASMLLARGFTRRALNASIRPERCLVLGDLAARQRIARSLSRTSATSAEVVAQVPMETAVELASGVGGSSELLAELERYGVDRVIVVPGPSDSQVLLDAVRVVKSLGVKVSVLPQLFEVVGSSVRVDDIDGLLLLGVRRQGLTTSSHALKRSFDVVAAGGGLVLLAPLVALCGGLAAILSRSAPLERHMRLTRYGRSFAMLSFRTKPAGSGGARRVGRLLERSGLHLLPRLVNVLRGHMSLVGPRPQPPEDAGPPSMAAVGPAGGPAPAAPRPAERQPLPPGEVPLRPGATGLWHTDGGGSPPPEEALKLDYLYSSNWSVWFDVRILLRSLALGGAQGVPPAVEAAGLPGAAAAVTLDGARSVAAAGPAPSQDRPAGAASSGGAADPLERTSPAASTLRLSVIVPATDSPPTLEPCLAGLRAALGPGDEILVVDRCGRPGPAAARNQGAASAKGDVLVFVDADVVVHRDALTRARADFTRDAELAATFGAYDDGLTSNGTVGTFRNLLHHHIHHCGAGEAGTFWSGLGAVRREAFLRCGGFDERFVKASVEDIDLGMRLSEQGRRIVLNPKIQGTHLKNWTLGDMVATDFHRRGVPWVGLLLRTRRAPVGSLNLSWGHRLSALSSLVAAFSLVVRRPRVGGLALLGLLGLNHRFYWLLARRYGPGMSVAGVALHVIHHLVSVAALPAGVAKHVRKRPNEPQRAVGRPLGVLPVVRLDQPVADAGHRNGVPAGDWRETARTGG